MTTLTLSQIVELRAAGQTLAAIGADHGVSRQAVHIRLRKAGLTAKAPVWEARRAALLADVQMLVSSGESPDQVVVRLGYASRASLARALRRAERPDLGRYVESGTPATPS